MVFSGALLHTEAHSQPRVDPGGRTARPAWLRTAGAMVGSAAVLGVHPRRLGTSPPSHQCRRSAIGLFGHLLRIRVLAMKKLLLLLPLLAVTPASAAKDSCIQCHANLDG